MFPGLFHFIKTIQDINRPIIEISTNGAIFHHNDFKKVEDYINLIKVNVSDGQIFPYNKATKTNVVAKMVYHDDTNDKLLENQIKYFSDKSIPMKIVFDLYAKKETEKKYNAFKQSCLIKKVHPSIVFTRTSCPKQYEMCQNCTVKCVAPKMLWVSPDGTSSHCPDNKSRKYQISDSYLACKDGLKVFK